jgi:RNA polymerase sigma factor (sigma-70 family)
MSGPRPADLLRHLAGGNAEAADHELLRRYVSTRDDGAFEELVRRHGPVVLAASRRGVRDHHAADDVFQAVFLVLARRAGGIRRPELLGNWLYGVAVGVARNARRAARRRGAREIQSVDVPEPVARDTTAPDDLGPVLDEELGALPAFYRDAVVLCDLRGVSRADAASQLGVPLGTLASRLDGGRKKLAARLVRRGVTFSVAAVLVEERAVAVPEVLLTKTCEVVAVWSSGGAVPAAVMKLVQGGVSMRGMMLGGVLAVSLVAGVVLAGVGPNPVPPTARSDAPLTASVSVAAEPVAHEQPKEPGSPKAKDVKLAAAPRLREPLDLPVRTSVRVAWSPTGDRLVVVGPPDGGEGGEGGKGGPDQHTSEVLWFVSTADLRAPQLAGSVNLPAPQRFVSFTPDGKHFVSAQREEKLVSGKHRVAVWAIDPDARGAAALPGGPPGGGGPGRPALGTTLRRSFDIDPGQSNDYAFAADGKNYRTLLLTRDDAGIREVAVQRVSAETGDVLETLAHDEVKLSTAQLSGDGRVVVVQNAESGALGYSYVDKKGGWAVAPDLGTLPGSAPKVVYPVGLATDGSKVVVSRGFNRPTVYDGPSGKAVSLTDATDLLDAYAGGATFSHDGRLVALSYSRVEKKESPLQGKGGGLAQGVSRGEARLGVWDTTTGRLVRSWPGRVTALAFHPSRPVLAVLEPNGDKTRLGLWDFTAKP